MRSMAVQITVRKNRIIKRIYDPGRANDIGSATFLFSIIPRKQRKNASVSPLSMAIVKEAISASDSNRSLSTQQQ